MSIFSSGAYCNVCGNPIFDGAINQFKINNSKMMHCHDKCLFILKKFNETEDESLLPESELKHNILMLKNSLFIKCNKELK